MFQSYDGAIGQDQHQEGHAGLTFCAIAALSLMGTLETALNETQVSRLFPVANLSHIYVCGFVTEEKTDSLVGPPSAKWISRTAQ